MVLSLIVIELQIAKTMKLTARKHFTLYDNRHGLTGINFQQTFWMAKLHGSNGGQLSSVG